MPASRFHRQRLWFLLTSFVLLAGLLPFLLLCAYVEPYSDDYLNAWRTRAYGPLGAQLDLYSHWTGRYFSSLLLTLPNPLTHGWPLGLRWVAGLQLLALPTTLYLGMRVSLGQRVSRWRSAWAAGLGLLLYLQLIPDVYSAVYWYTSSVVYTAGQLSFLLVFVASGVGLRARRGQATGWLVVAGLAAVGTAGSNEVQLLLLLASLAALLLLSRLHADAPAQRWWTSLLLLTAVAGAVALLAPGNFARLADKITGEEPIRSKLLFALPRVVRILFSLLADVRVLGTGAVMYLLLKPRASRWQQHARLFGRQRVPLRQSPPLLLAALGVAELIVVLSFGGYSPPRVHNALLYFLLLGWAVAIVAAEPARPAAERRWEAWVRQSRWTQALAWLGIIALCATGSPRRAWQEWLYSAKPYQRQMRQRYALLQAAARNGQRQVTVPPILHLRPYHVLVTGQDLAAWPGYFANKETAQYFGLESLVIDENLLPQTHHDFGGSWLEPEGKE